MQALQLQPLYMYVAAELALPHGTVRGKARGKARAKQAPLEISVVPYMKSKISNGASFAATPYENI